MKNNKKIKKMLSRLLTITMICSAVNTVVLAGSGAATDIKKSVLSIVNAVAYIGYVIAFGMLFFLGAKYTLSPANEKADVKQGSINYLIGALLILCASGIANLISGIATGGGGGGAGGLASTIVGAAQSAVQ